MFHSEDIAINFVVKLRIRRKTSKVDSLGLPILGGRRCP